MRVNLKSSNGNRKSIANLRENTIKMKQIVSQIWRKNTIKMWSNFEKTTIYYFRMLTMITSPQTYK